MPRHDPPRRLAHCLLAASLLSLALLAASCQGNLAIRGHTLEVGIRDSSIEVLRAIPPHDLVPIRYDLPRPFVQRTLMHPHVWITTSAIPGTFWLIGIPLWIPTAFVLLATGITLRQLGLWRHARSLLGRLRTASPTGLGLLVSATFLFTAMVPRTIQGVFVGPRAFVSFGAGAFQIARNKPTTAPMIDEYRRVFWYSTGPFFSSPPVKRVWGWRMHPVSAPFYYVPGWFTTADSYFVIPLWLPAALCAATGSFFCWRRYPRAGVCTKCRYSLAGLPPNAPCPECGHPS